MKDRHVTYREIEISLVISAINILSILHEHLAVKNFCSRWFPQSLKKAVLDWQNTMAVLRKTFIRSSKVTNHEFMRMSPNKTTVHHVGPRRQAKSNESCFWKKHLEANGSLFLWQSWSCSDCYTWATLHGQFSVVHHNFFGEIRKMNKKSPVNVLCGHVSSCTSAQISAFSTGQIVELMGQPPQWLLLQGT